MGLRFQGQAVATVPTVEQRRGDAPLSAQLVIGTGVKMEAYYSSQIVFKDAFKQSQPFWHQQNDSHWPDGEATPFVPATSVSNTNGYPNQDPVGGGWWKTHMRANIGGNYESGTYKVFFDGEAIVEVKGDTGATWASVANGGSITVTPTAEGIHLRLSGIVTPPSYIHVVPAAYEANYQSAPFHPTWMASIAHYKVLRWMDSCGVSSELSAWANRTVMASQTQCPKLNRGAIANPNYASYGGGWPRYWQDEWGMAVEFAIDVCNAIGADFWWCLPPKCSDDYVTQLATLVKARLDPRLRFYIEYGNECWNNAAVAGVWMAIQTNTRPEVMFPWSHQPFSYIPPGVASNEHNFVNVLGLWFQAWRGSQCMQLARAVYGAAAPTSLVRVFGCHLRDSWAMTEVLTVSGAHRDFDAIAPAFYWGQNELVPWGESMDTWRNYCMWKIGETGVDRPDLTTVDLDPALIYGESDGDSLRRTANAIRRFGKRILGYEGGQHIIPTDGAEVTEWSAVQNDAIMREVYLQTMRVWLRICGADSPFLHYVDVGGWGTSGTWGSRTHIGDVTSRKYLAMKDVATGAVQL